MMQNWIGTGSTDWRAVRRCQGLLNRRTRLQAALQRTYSWGNTLCVSVSPPLRAEDVCVLDRWVQERPKGLVRGVCERKVLWDLCQRKRPSPARRTAHPIKVSKGWAGFKGEWSEPPKGPYTPLMNCCRKLVHFWTRGRTLISHWVPQSVLSRGSSAVNHWGPGGWAVFRGERCSAATASFTSGAPLTDWGNGTSAGVGKTSECQTAHQDSPNSKTLCKKTLGSRGPR